MQTVLKHSIFLVLFFFGYALIAQDYSTEIEGRVYSKDGDVAATHISNLTRNRGTITDLEGFFNIAVRLNDTLVFSAVQFKKKEVVVTIAILKSKKLVVGLEDAMTALEEVVVMPYNLSGKLNEDTGRLQLGPIITASSENLPNANVILLSQTERKLAPATDWDCNCVGVKLDPLFNYFSGRTKMLNERAARDAKVELNAEVRTYFEDEIYSSALNIATSEIDNFIYYCELDTAFSAKVAAKDQLLLLDFMKQKSILFRKQRQLD